MHYEAVLLSSSQQLATICVVMSTCQIVHGQFGFTDIMSSMFGLRPRRPPRNYHYESRGHIESTYPRNSYQIMDYEVAKARGLLAHQKKGGNKQKRKTRGGGAENGDDDGYGEPAGGDDGEPAGGGDGEPAGGGDGGDPGLRDDDLPVDKPDEEKRRKRSYSASSDVGGYGAMAVHAVLQVQAADERVRDAAAVPPDDDASAIRASSPPSTTDDPGKSKNAHNRDANIIYLRRSPLSNIVKYPSTDSSQFYNEESNNNVYKDKNNDSSEIEVDEHADGDDDKDIFYADDSNSAGYGYNKDEKDDGSVDDSPNFTGYKSDHKRLENDDKSILIDADETRLKTFLKLTKKIQLMFIMETSGKKLVHYVNSLYMILKELMIDIQKFFGNLVYTAMKFEKSVAAENIQKCIATMINTIVLFIANALDQ